MTTVGRRTLNPLTVYCGCNVGNGRSLFVYRGLELFHNRFHFGKSIHNCNITRRSGEVGRQLVLGDSSEKKTIRVHLVQPSVVGLYDLVVILLNVCVLCVVSNFNLPIRCLEIYYLLSP